MWWYWIYFFGLNLFGGVKGFLLFDVFFSMFVLIDLGFMYFVKCVFFILKFIEVWEEFILLDYKF